MERRQPVALEKGASQGCGVEEVRCASRRVAVVRSDRQPQRLEPAVLGAVYQPGLRVYPEVVIKKGPILADRPLLGTDEAVAQNPLTFRRPPVTVLPAIEAVGTAEPRIAALICAAVEPACSEAYRAAAPVTCGVAMEVPS